MSIHYTIKFADNSLETYTQAEWVLEVLADENDAVVFITDEETVQTIKQTAAEFVEQNWEVEFEDPREAYEDFRYHSNKHEAA